MRRQFGYLWRFGIVAALLGFFSPGVKELRLSNGSVGYQLKILCQAEARRGGRGGGRSFRGGGGRSFRGGGMRSRPSFNRSRPSPSVSRSRNYGGNFHRAPRPSRPAASRPKATRPVSKRPAAKRPGQSRPTNKRLASRPAKPQKPAKGPSVQPVKKPGNTRPGQTPNRGPVSIQPTINPATGKPMKPNRPGNGERPNRPDRPNRPGNGKPITIQPIVNPGTGKPMPGQPGTRPPGQRPPGVRPPHDRPPHGKPPHRPPYHGHPGWHDDDWWHVPAAIGAGIVIGSVVASLPPSCQTEVVGGTTYYYCDGTWYLPYYEGSVLKYKVVDAPR